MYPLLISAATTVASNLIDKWAEVRKAKVEAQAAPVAENFATVLTRSAGAPAAAGVGVQTAALRQRVLDSPEVHTLLASADPAKLPTLSLAADGTVTARGTDGRMTTVPLSPDGAAAARELAALTAAKSASVTTSAGKMLPPVTFPVLL